VSYFFDRYSLNQNQLSKLIKANSHCKVQEICADCSETFDRFVPTKGYFKFNYPVICPTCNEKIEQEQIERKKRYDEELRIEQEKIEQESKEKFEKAIADEKWLELNDYELSTLRTILRNNNLTSVFKNVFKDDLSDKYIWSVITKLDKLGLIQTRRNNRNYLDAIEVDPRMLHHLKDPTKGDKVNMPDYFGFSLSKKLNKTTPNQPDYGGTFILPTDIILRANETYVYGGWILSDGSINLKFTPAKDIHVVEQTTFENEPQKVRDIIEGMFNHLRKDKNEDEEEEGEFVVIR
jgi:uncharacterized Zn finger protein (UPF0148 family)